MHMKIGHKQPVKFLQMSKSTFSYVTSEVRGINFNHKLCAKLQAFLNGEVWEYLLHRTPAFYSEVDVVFEIEDHNM